METDFASSLSVPFNFVEKLEIVNEEIKAKVRTTAARQGILARLITAASNG